MAACGYAQQSPNAPKLQMCCSFQIPTPTALNPPVETVRWWGRDDFRGPGENFVLMSGALRFLGHPESSLTCPVDGVEVLGSLG